VTRLNRLEEVSILTAATTIYCGLLYLTDEIGEVTKMLLFIILVVVNTIFITMWIHGLFEAIAVAM